MGKARKTYERGMLADEAERARVASELSGRRWTMSVTWCAKGWGFLGHPTFPEGVFAHHSAWPPSVELAVGDRVEARVAPRWDKKRRAWSYGAVEIEVAEPARELRTGRPPDARDGEAASLGGAGPAAGGAGGGVRRGAWPLLIGVLIGRASGQVDDKAFRRAILRMGSSVPGAEGLRRWRFDEALASSLRTLQSTVDGMVFARKAGDQGRLRHLASLYARLRGEGSSAAWLGLFEVAGAHLECRGVPISSLLLRSPGPSSSSAEGKGAALRGVPVGGGAKGESDPKRRALERLGSHVLAVPRALDFSRSASTLSIYIDEAWPGANDPGSDPRTGVVAGIVWEGEGVEESVLKRIPTHGRGSLLAVDALRRLLECPRALPFLMPVRVPCDLAQHRYFQLIEAAVKVLLGWLLPQEGTECAVRILVERFSKPDYWDGADRTEYFRGVFNEARLASPARFGRWRLLSVRWCDKNEEYVPYGDCIGYLALEHTESNRRLGELASYRKWPGYLPLSLELLPRLSRLDHFESAGNVDDLLDFVVEAHGTELCRTVLADFGARLANRKDLRRKLLEALDERYRAKARDLRVLRRLFEATRTLAPLPREGASARLRLLWILSALRDANHHGDPERAREAASRYGAVREEVLPHDRELVARADLNLAVHLNDGFRFEEARTVNEELVSSPGFPFLPPLVRAMALSSLGQSLSIAGRYLEADGLFRRAAEVARQADPDDRDVESELEQTGVYRAINAQDGDLEGASALARAVLGDFGRAVEDLAEDGGARSQYRHHLLVRSLWTLEGMEAAVELYLDRRGGWRTGDQHPWELVAMYRGLLLWARGPEGALREAREWLREALGICALKPHGVTVRLIGAMIAAAASCCVGGAGPTRAGDDFLNEVESRLPRASAAVGTLRDVLRAPAPERLREALSALPFNYR